ncbi:MAG: ABC transporter permease [Actinobacteria bacterium]|nr:ABC transporter permease [Actinomycetota bacterium]
MAQFVIRRVIWTIPVILLVILLIFVLMRQIEGNPFRKSERAVPEAVQANLERKFNLDKPWYMQYAYYVKDVFTFNLGPSLVLRDRTVNEIIEQHFPVSVKLGLMAFAWALLIGIPTGALAALRPNSIFDYAAMFFSNIGFALPNFLVATLLIYYVALQAGLVPTNGWPRDFWDFTDPRLLLPTIALGLTPMAFFARLTRGTMLETLQQDYVRTAKAKGLRWRRVVGLHVLRNSLIPVVTATIPLLGLILTGTFVIELIFSIPGIGRYFVTAVGARDYSVVMGITVLTSVVVILGNLIVDILYGFLDPRTREARA